MRKWIIIGALFFAKVVFAVAPSSAPQFSKRHILILQMDATGIVGMYYFGVYNATNANARLTLPVMLAKESRDVSEGEGLQEGELSQDANGAYVVNKEFPPGLSLVSVLFRVPVESSPVQLTFQAPVLLEELSVAVPDRSLLRLHSQRLVPGLPHSLVGSSYRGLQSRDAIGAGEEFQVQVEGFPRSRMILWAIAGFLFTILVVVTLLLRFRKG